MGKVYLELGLRGETMGVGRIAQRAQRRADPPLLLCTPSLARTIIYGWER
jgi:hypothetical protein